MRNLSLGICGLALGLLAMAGFTTGSPKDPGNAQVRSAHGFTMDFEKAGCGTKDWQVRSDGYAAEVISWDAAWGTHSLRLH
ncbi:MAG: hypothetical protein HONBIEJF_02810 [Fimbriimonadaceae bacterium]|nr:hypothetical protein [Fimbriimonadaceae bacterium]